MKTELHGAPERRDPDRGAARARQAGKPGPRREAKAGEEAERPEGTGRGGGDRRGRAASVKSRNDAAKIQARERTGRREGAKDATKNRGTTAGLRRGPQACARGPRTRQSWHRNKGPPSIPIEA